MLKKFLGRAEAPLGEPLPRGPKPLPLVGNLSALKAGLHASLPGLVAKHGGIFTLEVPAGLAAVPLVYFGGPTVVLADPALLEELFRRPDDFSKRLFKHSALRWGAQGKGIFTTDDDEDIHGSAFRVLAPSFSLKSLQSYFGAIQSGIATLMGILSQAAESREAVDVHPLMSQYMFDTFGLIGFGKDFQAMTQKCPLLDSFEGMMKNLGRLSKRSTAVGKIGKGLVTGDLNAFRRKHHKAWVEIDQILEWKRAECEKDAAPACPVTGSAASAGSSCPVVKDMCARLVSEPDPKTGQLLPEELMHANATTLLIAGHDTTSTAMTMLLYHIATNPDVEEKLHREVRDVVGERELTWDLVSKLPYTSQVIKESLRLFSPVPEIYKTSPPDRATRLGPYHIPPGTTFCVSQWGIHYNPQVYDDPEKFDPDRWAEDKAGGRSSYAWLPFSSGERACIGLNLSLLEQRVMLAEVVRKFYLRLDPQTNLRVRQPLFLNPQGIYLRLTSRRSSPAPPPSRRDLQLVSLACLDPGASESRASIESDASESGGLRGKRVVVLYGSNMGTCGDFAEQALEIDTRMGFEGVKAPLDALASSSPPALPKGDEGVVVIITSTYNGRPPDNAKAFDAWLSTPSAESVLQGVRFAVFGCGNSQWSATYLRFAKRIQEAFEHAGAEALTAMGEGDMDCGKVEHAFARWSLTRRIAILHLYDIPVPPTLAETLYPRPPAVNALVWHGHDCKDMSDGYRRSVMQGTSTVSKMLQDSDAWFGALRQNTELLKGDASRSTRHIEFALPEGQAYIAGDHLGVIPANPEEVVLAYLRRVRMEPAAIVKFEAKGEVLPDLPPSTAISAFMVLSYFLELQQPATQVQLFHLAKRSEGVTKKRLEDLADFEGEEYGTYVTSSRRTVLEVLEEFRDIEVSFGFLVALLPPMKPRYYSISSSPKVMPDTVSISVSVVRGVSPTSRRHLGVCSNFLADQPRLMPDFLGHKDSTMPSVIYIKDTGSSFRLPAPSVPVIMVGPGTGFAPMRGFIQDRVADKARHNLLFFGCRNDSDFIYEDELQAWHTAGWLDLHVAFSRKEGSPKTYVQHLIATQAKQIAEMVQQGGHIYVCGDASRMAPDVRAAFSAIFEGAGLGAGYLSDMLDAGRYCQDVWAAQSVG